MTEGPPSFDLYVWASPRDLPADEAAERIAAWEADGADPDDAPFEASGDVGWFYVELLKDRVDVDAISDGVPDPGSRPIWLTTTPAAPARIVAMRLRAATTRDDLETIYGLAAKYDLVLFEPRGRTVRAPLADMAEHASATFWPSGAIQAFVAGSAGAAIAVASWVLGIPVISWVGILVGGFLVVGAVYTFVVEGRRRWRGRGPTGAGAGPASGP
jgi:hypothetical protein